MSILMNKMVQMCQDFTRRCVSIDDSSLTLSNKTVSALTSQVYTFVETGIPLQRNNNKDCLLFLFRGLATQFVGQYIIKTISTPTIEPQFIRLVSKCWKNFKLFVLLFRTILIYADDYYRQAAKKNMPIETSESVYPVAAVALFVFKSIVIESPGFMEKIKTGVISAMKRMRKEKKMKCDKLKGVVEMIWSCCLGKRAMLELNSEGITFRQQKNAINDTSERQFAQRLLQPMLQSIKGYFFEESPSQIANLIGSERINLIATMTEWEDTFAREILVTPLQRTAYRQIVDQHFLLGYADLIYDSQLRKLVEDYLSSEGETCDGNLKTVEFAYKLSLRIDKVGTAMFEGIISEAISSVNKEVQSKIGRPKEYMTQFLKIVKKTQVLLETSFQGNFRISLIIQRLFKKVLESIESAHTLAEHTDSLLRECHRLKAEEDVCSEKLEVVLLILSWVAARDSFLLYHQEFMGRRLLDAVHFISIEIEEWFLKQMANQLGSLLLSNHYGMLKDIEASSQKSYGHQNIVPAFKSTLKILSSFYWPESILKNNFTIEIPRVLVFQTQIFESQFKRQNESNVLNWQLEKGVSLFEGRFTNGKVRFQAENLYLMILLHIDAKEKGVSLFELIELISSSLEEPILHHYVNVLVDSRLLVKGSQQRYTSNVAYVSQGKSGQTVIIRASADITKLLRKTGVQKNKLIKDREKLIEAALVKSLKHAHSNKSNSISFAELYEAIQTHPYLGGFNFTETQVKLRLEQLQAKEFCERDENDRRIYRYKA